MDLKENLAINLVKYRKALGYTQAEIAQKLNYSDKSVSKWERGEAIPDLLVLKQLADLYHVKIDTLIDTPKSDKPKFTLNTTKKRICIYLATISFVWIIAILGYVFIDVIFPVTHTWLSFIYAACATSVVSLIFSLVWRKYSLIALFISMFIWTAIVSVYLTLLFRLTNPPSKLWEVFLIGIPLQIATLFVVLYKKLKTIDFKHKEKV